MKELNPGEIAQTLLNLSGDQRIYVPIEPETAAQLELIHMKRIAMENLFSSYVDRTSEEAEKMDLTQFVEMYTVACIEDTRKQIDILLSYLGRPAYIVLASPENKLVWQIDFIIKQIMVYKSDGRNVCTTCSL